MHGLMEELKVNALLEIIGVSPNDNSTKALYESYLKAEEAKGIIERYMASVREELFNRAEKEGLVDSKGTYTVKFSDGSGFKKQARIKVEISLEKIKELAKKKHLALVKYEPKLVEDDLNIRAEAFELLKNHLPQAIEYDELVDETALENAYMEGKIDDAEMMQLVMKTTTYALVKIK